jgi:hypothetical protein
MHSNNVLSYAIVVPAKWPLCAPPLHRQIACRTRMVQTAVLPQSQDFSPQANIGCCKTVLASKKTSRFLRAQKFFLIWQKHFFCL